MKNINRKQSGFTLIEIIVVLIILGILAAIALPNLFNNVSKSKAAQALTTMAGYKTPLEGCVYNGGTVGAGNCTLAGQNLATTATISGTTWTFSLPAAASAATATAGAVTNAPSGTGASALYAIQASDGTNTIVLNRGNNGVWTCSTGTASPYTGVC